MFGENTPLPAEKRRGKNSLDYLRRVHREGRGTIFLDAKRLHHRKSSGPGSKRSKRVGSLKTKTGPRNENTPFGRGEGKGKSRTLKEGLGTGRPMYKRFWIQGISFGRKRKEERIQRPFQG